MDALPQMSYNPLARGAPFVAWNLTFTGPVGWYDRRDYYSIAIVNRGEGTVRSAIRSPQSSRSALPAGRIVFLRPGDATYWRPDDLGLSLMYVGFPLATWRSYAKLVGLGTVWERLAQPPSDAAIEAHEDFSEAFLGAIDRFDDVPTIFDLVQFWTTVIPELLRGASLAAARTAPPTWLAECLETMREEHHLRAGVSRFVELAHVSSGYLAALTRRHFGQTPIALVNEIRLQHASCLLRATSDSVGDIAHRCGFGEVTYFTHRFRREYGVSPRTYRTRLAAIEALPDPR